MCLLESRKCLWSTNIRVLLASSRALVWRFFLFFYFFYFFFNFFLFIYFKKYRQGTLYFTREISVSPIQRVIYSVWHWQLDVPFVHTLSEYLPVHGDSNSSARTQKRWTERHCCVINFLQGRNKLLMTESPCSAYHLSLTNLLNTTSDSLNAPNLANQVPCYSTACNQLCFGMG